MNICPECGKKHVVHWPEFWPYRRYNTYYCSFNCIDVSVTRDLKKLKDADRKKRERKMKKKDYSEIAREFIRIKEAGGGNMEIYDYLESIGYNNPETAYYYIRKSLKKSDPELEAKIGNSKPGPAEKKEAPEEPKAEPEETTVELVYDESIAEEYRREQAEKAEKILAEGITIRNKYVLDCDVTAIRVNELGEFYHDVEHNCIDWRNPFGDEISLPLQGWKNLAEDLPAILQKLGVEL
jgi:hypothetical protein